MTHFLRKTSLLLLSLLLIPVFSGCQSSNSAEQAERCLTALSIVQSADSIHATISQAFSENELEISAIVEYWKSDDNSLCSTTYVGVEDAPQVWDLKYNGACYTKSVYEEPVEEGVEYPVNWTRSDGSDPDPLAFWQAFHRTAEDLSFVSQEKVGNNEILTFQIPLSDEEKQAADGAQFSDYFVSFTLGEADTLLEFEARHTVTVDADSAQYSAIWLNHAVFEDINDDTIVEKLETEISDIN